MKTIISFPRFCLKEFFLVFKDYQPIGTISIKIDDGVVRTLINVRHVPNLTRNLISLGILDETRYDFKAKSGRLNYPNKPQQLRAELREMVFIFGGKTIEGHSCVVSKLEQKTRQLYCTEGWGNLSNKRGARGIVETRVAWHN